MSNGTINKANFLSVAFMTFKIDYQKEQGVEKVTVAWHFFKIHGYALLNMQKLWFLWLTIRDLIPALLVNVRLNSYGSW